MSFITNPLVYYPISGILWFWHKIFAFLGGLLPWVEAPDSNGLIWALSVLFLVVTLRLLLFWPAAKQIRFSRKMQELQPRMKELQKRYKNDREKLVAEQRKLQKSEGFNPVLGCLPMFIQIPVFLGLFHVLRSFNRMGENFGALGMTAEETRNTGNYVFSAEEVQSFLDARLFGAPLSSFISQPVEQFEAFVQPGAVPDFERWNIIVVAIPLMIVSAVTTHLNARISLSRQSPEAAANPQAKIMNQLMLWAFPIGILVTGAFWPMAILVYMVTNNLWTLGQQYYLYEKMAKEDSEAALKRQEERKALAPRVGVKPVNPKKTAKAGGRPTGSGTEAKVAVVEEAGGDRSSDDDDEEAAPRAPEKPSPGAAPRPGQKPQRPGGQRTRPAQKKSSGGKKKKKKKR